MAALRIVVTGATGNVGTSVVRSLLASGRVDEVLGLAAPAREEPRGLPLGPGRHRRR